MLVEYSLSRNGRVAPLALPALLNEPSESTMTKPDAPGVVPKVSPGMLAADMNWAVVRPVAWNVPAWPPMPLLRPVVCVSQ